jgi:hypothetical protein
MDEIEKLIDEARDLARLICPLPQEVDEGAEIARMPDDLMRAAAAIANLCDCIQSLRRK